MRGVLPWMSLGAIAAVHLPLAERTAAFFLTAPGSKVGVGAYLFVVMGALWWFQRERVLPVEARGEVRTSWGLVALGAVLLMMGVLSGESSWQTLSLPVCLHAWSRTVWPEGVAERRVVPAYLWMVWVPFCEMPAQGSRLADLGCHVAAYLGGAMLQVAGYPTVVDGTFVFTRGVPNTVEAGCDGFTIFATVAFFALALGSYRGHAIGRIAKVFALALPVAVLGNAARVATVSAAYDRWGEDYPSVWAHDMPSFVTAAVCFVGVYLALKAKDPVYGGRASHADA